MSNYSTVDRESFQELLASAFAVQQLDSQSRSLFVEVGRLVTRGDLDLDGAVHLIGDLTRNLANTTGVAIGLLSADIALELALKDIAEQARLATKAGAAAISLTRGEEMLCRASTGKTTLELRVLLDARVGLSSVCAQTREAQVCSDTEADSRIDTVACRRLGIRSFLISPLLNQGELVGLFAIFSPRPKAFGDREIQVLQALSRQVLTQVDSAVELSTPPPGDEPSTAADSEDAWIARFRDRLAEGNAALFRPRDLSTPVLVISVIALVLLGWMLGRVIWP
jgi:GAF domain-containing protein